MPLGLVMIGCPLVVAGHHVTLRDGDALGLLPREVAAVAVHTQASVVLVGHSGLAAAKPTSIKVISAIKSTAFGNNGLDPSHTT